MTNRKSAKIPDIKSLFEWQDPKVIGLAEEVFERCILSKIFPPEAPLNHRWLAPGGIFRAQWIYDTPFVVDILSVLPRTEKVIREVFQNFWDFQRCWNRSRPEYAHNMIQCNMWPGEHQEGSRKFPLFSQMPILAWGVERVFRRNGDTQLLQQCLQPLELFHEWYWRERDVCGAGLVAVGTYSGRADEAHFEGFDHECNLDGLKLTTHPGRKTNSEETWYGDICVPGNTAHLVAAEKSLKRLAELAGDTAMAARRQTKIDKATEAMRNHMWEKEAGTFLAVKRDTLEKIPVATCGSWIPLWAGIPTKSMAKQMAEALSRPNWRTPMPLSTVDRNDPRWRSDGGFRGAAWPSINYQIAGGLADYGFRDLAAEITDKTIANVFQNGIAEYYDATTGTPLGVTIAENSKELSFNGMTCTIVTMMLDGLTRKYILQVRAK